MNSVDIRRNDTVKVIAGRDKGKEGRVLRVFPKDQKVLVEHVMMVKKSVRPNPQRNINRRAGKPYLDLERDAGLRFVREAVADPSRDARRQESACLRRVRKHPGEVTRTSVRN
jgi:ribosomal protein L24